jgi:glycosyltransferase involved in cell wall biosynthesis
MRTELTTLEISEVVIIPVPVDTTRFRRPTELEKRDARARLELVSESVILFVGHLQERKGIDLLLRALRNLRNSGRNACLVVVGGPVESIDRQYVQRLKNYVNEEGLANDVIFCGAQDDVLPFMFAADVFCLPSHREGMPNVLLEAMACGLSCVAPASAGGDELLFGGAGIIPLTNSPEDLSEAIDHILIHAEERSAVGASAAFRVGGENQPVKIVEEYEKFW